MESSTALSQKKPLFSQFSCIIYYLAETNRPICKAGRNKTKLWKCFKEPLH